MNATSGITRALALKEPYLNRWAMLACGTAAVLSAGLCAFGRVAFNVGAIGWLTAIIACGVMLAIYGVANERKEHSLQFVLSLPVSPRQYIRAKTIGMLLAFLPPWGAAMLAAVALVLLSPGVPDGMLPFVCVIGGFLLANFALVLCGALHARSEGLMVGVIIVTNMAVSIFMFVVGALPGIASHMTGPVPVWNDTVAGVLLAEAVVFVLALLLPQITAARRRDLL